MLDSVNDKRRNKQKGYNKWKKMKVASNRNVEMKVEKCIFIDHFYLTYCAF